MSRMPIVAAIAAIGLAVSATAESADAGRFRIFRRATTQRSIQRPWTIQTSRNVNARPRPVRRQTPRQIGGQKQWPGAIGSPSPRYQVFQDTLGYWN